MTQASVSSLDKNFGCQEEEEFPLTSEPEEEIMTTSTEQSVDHCNLYGLLAMPVMFCEVSQNGYAHGDSVESIASVDNIARASSELQYSVNMTEHTQGVISDLHRESCSVYMPEADSCDILVGKCEPEEYLSDSELLESSAVNEVDVLAPSDTVGDIQNRLSRKSSIDADSEVAMTLASLGSVKQELSLSHFGKSTRVSANHSLPDQLEDSMNIQVKDTFSNAKTSLKISTGSIVAEPFLNGNEGGNSLVQLLRASEHCASPTATSRWNDTSVPSVGYCIIDKTNLSKLMSSMHACSKHDSVIKIMETASLSEGAVSHLTFTCSGCEKTVSVTSSNKHTQDKDWDINLRLKSLKNELKLNDVKLKRLFEILGLSYYSEEIFDTPDKMCSKSGSEMASHSVTQKVTSEIIKKDSPRTRSVKCLICSQSFTGVNYLNKHMTVHNDETHRCPYCYAYFKRTFNLKEHIKKHENYKFECEQCGSLYTDRSSLIFHIKSYHDKQYDYKCPYCNKQFCKSGHLKSHIRLHTGERPYSCRLCDRTFPWPDSVKKHMLTHYSENQYRCKQCGRGFRWESGIRNHIMTQHKVSSQKWKEHMCKEEPDPSSNSQNMVDDTAVEEGIGDTFSSNLLPLSTELPAANNLSIPVDDSQEFGPMYSSVNLEGKETLDLFSGM